MKKFNGAERWCELLKAMDSPWYLHNWSGHKERKETQDLPYVMWQTSLNIHTWIPGEGDIDQISLSKVVAWRGGW